MIIFLQHPFDLKRLRTIKNPRIITFDHESHKILSQNHISHTQSEEFLTKDDYNSIEITCHEWAQWFHQESFNKIFTIDGINLGSLFEWEFHFYLVPIIKKIFEIKKISARFDKSECICSSFLESIAEKFFKSTELFDEVKIDNPQLFDNVKWNLTNDLEISIKKENFEKMKNFSEKILLNFSKLNERKDNKDKSILFVEFDPTRFENLCSKMADSKIKPIFFNHRRPYFWDRRSFKIINKTEGEIITYKDNSDEDNDKNIIKKKIESIEDCYFKKYFSLNDKSFWEIIKDDFLKMIYKKMKDGIKLIRMGKDLFNDRNIQEIIIWSENGFSEQVIIELGKKRKIPINLIQHGIIVDEDNKKNHEFNRFSGILPIKSDRYLAWNRSTQDYIISSGFAPENIIQIGNTNFDLISNDKKYEETGYVLLATTAPIKNQHAGYNSKLLDNYEYELSVMCKKIKEQNRKLIVRPHPFSQEFKVDNIVKDSFPDAIIDKKTDITTLIKKSEVLVSYGISTIIFEAQILEKPVFFIRSEHDMFGIPKYLKKIPESMMKFDEIGDYISKIYEKKEYKNSIIRTNSTIMSDEFFNLGQSTENFLRFYE